ncbi:uncharacterized protein CLUP02_09678 [Colletotrichum lupini]|uniref:Uncharacterized protein n=1 Tax=Colletotrichum lupini TaxID=145971 RepID=A0A9Q8SX18_9PEZI|nr:uncharacterized protein CLUP02_09678 [Colletotrichum lupini]UQC84182.1 hypothetical protein CLUP02_09678 [Colletotrichum lupini]
MPYLEQDLNDARGWEPEVGSEEEVAFLAAVMMKETEGIDMKGLDLGVRSHILLGVMCSAFDVDKGQQVEEVERRLDGQSDVEENRGELLRQILKSVVSCKQLRGMGEIQDVYLGSEHAIIHHTALRKLERRLENTQKCENIQALNEIETHTKASRRAGNAENNSLRALEETIKLTGIFKLRSISSLVIEASAGSSSYAHRRKRSTGCIGGKNFGRLQKHQARGLFREDFSLFPFIGA